VEGKNEEPKGEGLYCISFLAQGGTDWARTGWRRTIEELSYTNFIQSSAKEDNAHGRSELVRNGVGWSSFIQRKKTFNPPLEARGKCDF